MAEPVQPSWTTQEFFAWQETQADRYELVDGRPLKMMAGAKNVHDDIVVNLVGELREQLRGSGCRPFTGDGSVETRPGQIRRPDVGVDRGPRDPNGTKAALPKVVIEVLSPSTRDFDSFGKLEEYKGVSSVEYILLVEPNAPIVSFWSRAENGQWGEQRIQGLAGAIEMPILKMALRMAGIYEGVAFPVVPRLVPSDVDSAARA
jgi:Uma2 family endonuclease